MVTEGETKDSEMEDVQVEEVRVHRLVGCCILKTAKVGLITDYSIHQQLTRNHSPVLGSFVLLLLSWIVL